MTHEIAIDCDILDAHAAKVSAIAQRLEAPIGAISYMTLGSDAYGLMCAAAAAPTTLMGVGAGASLAATRELLERSSRIVKLITRDFAECEATAIDGIRTLDAQLGGGVAV